MPTVFVSYARENRTRIETLARELEGLGWSVWWDRVIPAGRTFADVIEEALASSSCVLVAWSQHSVRSEWVREEADEGRRRGILIPLLLDAVSPPIGFRGIQAADLTGWDGTPASPAFRRLVADMDALVGRPSVAADVRTAPPAPPADPRPPLAERPPSSHGAQETGLRPARVRPRPATTDGRRTRWLWAAPLVLLLFVLSTRTCMEGTAPERAAPPRDQSTGVADVTGEGGGGVADAPGGTPSARVSWRRQANGDWWFIYDGEPLTESVEIESTVLRDDLLVFVKQSDEYYLLENWVNRTDDQVRPSTLLSETSGIWTREPSGDWWFFVNGQPLRENEDIESTVQGTDLLVFVEASQQYYLLEGWVNRQDDRLRPARIVSASP